MDDQERDIYQKLQKGVGELYERKMSFHRSNFKTLSRRNLTCMRIISIILMLINVFLYVCFAIYNRALSYNFFYVTLCYYSLWGQVTGMACCGFAILASWSDRWYNVAFWSTEVAAAVNMFIQVIYWPIIYPSVLT